MPRNFKKVFLLALMLHVSYNHLIGQLNDNYIRIVQISDTQLGFTGDSLKLDEAYFEQAVESINKLNPKPDVVINTGDLVNNPNNEEQWNDYVRISKMVEAPYYEIMGNHDGWSVEGLSKFRDRFKGNDYYSFTVKNCLFVALNSWYLKEPEKNLLEAKKQQQFLDSTLQVNNSSKYKFILIHHPLYLKTPDEKEEYFTLPVEQRKWLLDVASKNNVKLILTGHYHRNSMVTYQDSLMIITTGPTSKPLGNNYDNTKASRGFRIIDVNPENGSVNDEYIPLIIYP
jgi:3',5'-cyclic AMP phosphodiesterase CpdA